MSASLIRCKGIADIVVALILTVKPSIIYNSVVTRFVHSVSGLHISDASMAPGFNQSIACMVGAVGIGYVVSAGSGPALHPMVFALNVSWAILGLLTCATPKAWGLGSSTLLMTSVNHALFSLVFYLKDPSVLRNLKKSTRVRWDEES
ncbi:hypothetical protein M413DRAFT_75784 [Hebeloma cylindrosporum]|uniref:Uncharacterized protein n=1 Tax=Hebeloma cylindrosporum TaxID=76867 RepID=A0A0C3C583_HEBCY|nr:hypothetical protein M413DRAFT_75784 [Hebeloma cylindrosporum h7]